MADEVVPNICVGICRIDEEKLYCKGCARTRLEILLWHRVGAEEKKKITRYASERKEQCHPS